MKKALRYYIVINILPLVTAYSSCCMGAVNAVRLSIILSTPYAGWENDYPELTQKAAPQKPVSIADLARQKMELQKRIDNGDAAAQAEMDALDAQFKTESQKIQDAAKQANTARNILLPKLQGSITL